MHSVIVLLAGLFCCVVICHGYEVMHYKPAGTDGGRVLQIVSTLIPPYLDVRESNDRPAPPESANQVLDTSSTDSDVNPTAEVSDAAATSEPEAADSEVTEANLAAEPTQETGDVASPSDAKVTPAANVDESAGTTKGDTVDDSPSDAVTTEGTVDDVDDVVSTTTPSPGGSNETKSTPLDDVAATNATATVSEDEIVESDGTTTPETATTTASDVITTTVAATTEPPEEPSPYFGFIPDIFDAMMPFLEDYDSYNITIVKPEEGGKSAYDIMMDYVQQGKADVAAAPMTVTINKDKRVDFTYPFLKFQAMIVMDQTHASRFSDLRSLVEQDKEDKETKFITYGVRNKGAIHKFLQQSDDPLHKKMIEYWEDNQFVLKQTDDDGINRVRLINYVHIMEGSLANWLVGQKPCTLTGVEAGFFSRQYAFAVQNQSPLRDVLNTAIIEIESNGAHKELLEKWLQPNQCESAAWRQSAAMGLVSLSWFVTRILIG